MLRVKGIFNVRVAVNKLLLRVVFEPSSFKAQTRGELRSSRTKEYRKYKPSIWYTVVHSSESNHMARTFGYPVSLSGSFPDTGSIDE